MRMSSSGSPVASREAKQFFKEFEEQHLQLLERKRLALEKLAQEPN